MKRRELVPCPSCARHVRSDEATCPFCSAAQSGALSPVRRTMSLGTSRAAAFALRAAVVTAGCADSHDREDEPSMTAEAGADAGRPHDAATSVPDAAADTALADANDTPRDGAAEASAEASVDAALDGGDEDAFVPIPIYGGVFPDPRTRAKV